MFRFLLSVSTKTLCGSDGDDDDVASDSDDARNGMYKHKICRKIWCDTCSIPFYRFLLQKQYFIIHSQQEGAK